MKGILMEIKGNKGIIMTGDGRFVKGKCPAGSGIGQEIYIKEEKNHFRYAAVAVLAFAVVFSGLFTSNFQSYGYAEIDINPSVEIAYNKDLKVVKTEGLNADGKELLKDIDTGFKGLSLEDAIRKIVDSAEDKEYDTEKLVVTYTVTRKKSDNSVEKEIKNKIEAAADGKVFIMEVDKKEYVEKRKNNKQPAKEILREKIEELGGTLDKDLEEYKVSELAHIMNSQNKEEGQNTESNKNQKKDKEKTENEKSSLTESNNDNEINDEGKIQGDVEPVGSEDNKEPRPGAGEQYRDDGEDDGEPRPGAGEQYRDDGEPRPGAGEQYRDDGEDDGEPRPGAGEQYRDDGEDDGEPRPGAGEQYRDDGEDDGESRPGAGEQYRDDGEDDGESSQDSSSDDSGSGRRPRRRR